MEHNSTFSNRSALDAARRVLDGSVLTRDEAIALANGVDADSILELVSIANRVRKMYAPEISVCSIVNAKSGRCNQNCRFCAQSVFYATSAETYPLRDSETILDAARTVFALGVRRFGYVVSGRGYLDPNESEFQAILETFGRLRRELPELKICASLGILSRETARALAEAGVDRYNMNLQTAPKRYADLIATTHSIDEKIETIRHLKEAGLSNCVGGIFGLGESWEDRVDLALAIRELDVEGSPLNVLLPIQGTPLENMARLTPFEATKIFAIFRLINPTKTLRFAAGRETTMKDFQGLHLLAGLNAFITGGYLTTRGRSVADDLQFLRSLKDF